MITVDLFYHSPQLEHLAGRNTKPLGLLVVEAKTVQTTLMDHLPQAIGEMFTTSQRLE